MLCIEPSNLFSISEANRNFSNIAKNVDSKNDAVIIKNNKPVYAVIDIEKYQTIIKLQQEEKEEKENSRVKGYAIIELDGVLKINGIRIIEGNSRMFAAMPNRKISDDKYIDYVYPVNKELREEIERAILEEYNKEN